MNNIKGTIYEDGYGYISKQVMRDKNLSPEAKAIYSYLCSFSGKGGSCFPGVETQCEELGMSFKRYLKHRKQLEEAGYLTIAKKKKINIYSILKTIKSKIGGQNDQASEKSNVADIDDSTTYIPGQNAHPINNSIINNINISKEEQVILDYCKERNIKITVNQIRYWLKKFTIGQIKKAVDTANVKKVINYFKYITACLNNGIINQCTRENGQSNRAIQNQSNRFNNFSQRAYTADDYLRMEKALLAL